MRTIYRYPIVITDTYSLELPLGAKFLHVDQLARAPHTPSMWFLVDPERELVIREFAILGTGNPVPDYVAPQEHLGTFQDLLGLVWHVFEVKS